MITFLRIEDTLAEKLGFLSIITSSFSLIFDKRENLSNWLKEFTSELEKDLKDVVGKSINDGIKDIAENIQMMAKLVDAKLHNSKTILPNDHDIFSDLADKGQTSFQNLSIHFTGLYIMKKISTIRIC